MLYQFQYGNFSATGWNSYCIYSGKKPMVKTIVKKYTESMEILMNCAAACENCVSVCINDGKPLSCCPICLDCADICMTMFRLEAHNSTFLKSMYALCAEICETCANECEKHA